MKRKNLSEMIQSLSNLTDAQVDKVSAALTALADARVAAKALGVDSISGCPSCSSKCFVRNGTQHGLQRFLCKACGKVFNAASGTPLSRLRGKAAFAPFAKALSEGKTIRKSARAAGISISRAFRWRHRFMEIPTGHQAPPCGGLLEVDEMFLRRSRKGECGLGAAARGRGGLGPGQGRFASNFVPVLVGRARGTQFVVDGVLKSMSKESIGAALAGSAAPGETVLMADNHKSYKEMRSVLGVEVIQFAAGKPKKAGIHVQSVNSYHERLRTWINSNLRGVSSKWLHSYLAWQRMKAWNGGVSAADYIRSALGTRVINAL